MIPDLVAIAFRGAILFVTSDFVQATPGQYVLGSADVAEQLAAEHDALLPTTGVVDAIYEQASCRPQPTFLDPARADAPAIMDRKIAKGVEACPCTRLVAGHKKTVVQSARPDRTAIYGWYDRGRMIQPYSMVHGRSYADYSQGVRLVYRYALLDGRYVPASMIMDEAYVP